MHLLRLTNMEAIAWAIFSAALALVGKLGFDMWVRRADRRSMAAALAGEIGGYIRNLKPAETASNLRQIAALSREERQANLAALPVLPTGHPAYDKLADKIGLLPPELTQAVSGFYNAVTGLRLLGNHLSSKPFLEASDKFQMEYISSIAKGIDDYIAPAQRTVIHLEKIWKHWI